MATDDAGPALLSGAAATSIAQLNPQLTEQTSRVVRGEITITWPYNSVTQTFAFILAEPDVRLRRAKGQVRVQLRGPSAKAVAETGCGGGDELLICLDGAAFGKDESPGRAPGTRVDWELQFAEKLTAQVTLRELDQTKLVQVGHPGIEAPTPTVAIPDSIEPPQPDPVSPVAPAPGPPILQFADEYRSPAYIKRARVSYGSLFEDGLDIFEEDGGMRGKGRKRSRFGRESHAWRYSSQSRSPDPEPQPRAEEDDHLPNSPPSRAQMADEGCQTMEVNVTPITKRPVEDQPIEHQSPSRNHRRLPDADDGLRAEENGGDSIAGLGTEPEKLPGVPNYSLFGTFVSSTTGPSVSALPYGHAVTTPLDTGLSLSDQVRFGFSHDPQLVNAPIEDLPVTSDGLSSQLPGYDREDAYPDSYLDRASAMQYPDVQPYEHNPEQLEEPHRGYRYEMGASVPVTGNFERNQWDVAMQAESYNAVEGSHFGADATAEGERITREHVDNHSDEIPLSKVPAGYRSYEESAEGLPEVIDASEESNADDGGDPEPGLVENEETYDSEDEVGVENEDDAVYDEDGDELEQGDYDQREYDAPSDDDEGSSEEEEEVQQEVDGRYEVGDTYDEDEYSSGESDEEDEEEGDEEEDESEEENPPARRPPQPPVSTGPVIISLLDSSDEEDEEPMPTPAPPPIPSPIPAPVSTLGILPDVFTQGVAATQPLSEPKTSLVQSSSTASESQTMPLDSGSLCASYSQTQVIDFALSQDEPGRQDPDNLLTTAAKEESQEEPSTGNTPSEATESRHSPAFLLVDEQPRPEVEIDAQETLAHGDFRKLKERPNFALNHSYGGDYEGTSSVPDRNEPMDDCAEIGPSSDAPDDDVTQQTVNEDTTMRDRHDEEASDKGLFARQIRPLKVAEQDPDYVYQPDDEVVEEEYEADRGNDLGDLDMVEEQSGSSPRPAAIHAAERTAKQLQEIHDVASRVDDELVETIEASQADGQQNSIRPQRDEPPWTETPEEATVAAISTDAEPMEIDEAPGNGGNQVGLGDAIEHEFTLTAPGIVPPPPQPDLESPAAILPSSLVSGSQNEVMALFSPTETQSVPTESLSEGEHGIAPVPVQSEPDLQKPDVGPLPTLSDAQALGQAGSVSGDDLEEEEIDLIIEAPPMPVPFHEIVQNPRAKSSSPVEDSGAQDASQEVKYPDLSPRGSETEVIMGRTEGTDDEEFGTAPSPSAQLLEELGDSQNSLAVKHYETQTTSQAVQENGGSIETVEDASRAEAQPTSSPGPNSSQETHEEGRRRSSRRAKTSAKTTMDELPPQYPEQDSEQQQDNQTRRKKAATPDPSIQFARQSLAAKRAKKLPEPIQSSPRVTRARSSSLQTTATTEDEADHSIALARASIASPSKTGRKSGKSATTLKGELTKRLKSDLPECLSLKSLRTHLKKSITAVGIVTTNPSRPVRAKSGPREYVMSFNITDVAIAPGKVIEVQLYRAHKDSLPTVKPGDGILLQNIQVQALANKDFGLRSDSGSAWAVFDVDDSSPQIKGPPVEDYEQYVDYIETLKEWYRALGASATEKLEKANQEITEGSQSK